MEYNLYSGVKANVKINFPWLKSLLDTSLRKTETAYAKVPLIFRAMNIRADNLIRVPFYFFRGGKETDTYPFEDSLPFTDLLRKSEMALMASGKSTVLILEKEFSGIKAAGAGLQWLNPFTVRVRSFEDSSGTRQVAFDQYINGAHYPRKKDYWSEDEIYYLREFSFEDDIGAGNAPAEVALADANAAFFLSTFLGKFFENGAIPPMIISTKDGVGKLPKNEVKTWFRDKVKNFLERILVLDGGMVEVKELSSEINSFDIDKIDQHVVFGVANAFGMSPTSLMAGSANRATAEFEDLHLMRTIEARARFHQSGLNKLLSRWGWRCEARIQELPEFQEDEEQRSGSLYNLTQAGVPLDRALEILGYDLSDEYVEELQRARAKRTTMPIQPVIPTEPEPDQLPVPDPSAQIKMDLKRWMQKAIRRFEEGKSAAVQFVSNSISEEEQRRIIAELGSIKSAEEIKAVFKNIPEYSQ